MSRSLATDDWARLKDKIYSLYIVENRSLLGEDGVIKLMEDHFDFKKSKSQYETRFKEWGFAKYSKGIPADFKIANYRVDKAKRRGTEIRAFQRGKPVTPKVLRTRGYLTAHELGAFEQALNGRCCIFHSKSTGFLARSVNWARCYLTKGGTEPRKKQFEDR
ncbi:Clr5 domain-containing protein [Lasiosphaeria hispida]|uniref:Clr5 domain-containing protein n=1 Tax=Lasiosphaeria hispida TaxID=260671 RepID=A0AAJ0MAV2_9PEZI|nr:Clr5 domain-containing protein [Lasiosphaeria hispida]